MIPKIPADISLPDPVLGTGSIITLIFGCLFIFLAFSRMKQLKFGQSGLYTLLAILFLSATTILCITALNIHNYQRLNLESEIVEIHFSRLGRQLYSADLVFTDSKITQQYELRGDEWQLDARIIKWKEPLALIGFNSIYRLDRLQGRYHDINQERNSVRSVFALNSGGNLDLWSIIQRYRKYLPWLDAYYGSASYLPMSDDSRFQIKMSQSGLLARPINNAARSAVREWE